MGVLKIWGMDADAAQENTEGAGAGYNPDHYGHLCLLSDLAFANQVATGSDLQPYRKCTGRLVFDDTGRESCGWGHSRL